MNIAHAAQDRRALVMASFVCTVACASGSSAPTTTAATPRMATAADTAAGRRHAAADTVPGLPPPGFGTLRQDDISLKLAVATLQVRATPLDESIIRLLSPDSYRAMSELKRSKSEAIAGVARRNAVRDLSLWYDVGTWRIMPDGHVCWNWNWRVWDSRRERCYAVYREGRTFEFYPQDRLGREVYIRVIGNREDY